MPNYFAHSGNTKNDWHVLHDHLQCVGRLAEQFAKNTNSTLMEAAYWAGLLHDLGKYKNEFQSYLKKERAGGIETHHAVYGAALAYQKQWLGPAFAIAGHHAGLHDLDQLQTLVNSSQYPIPKQLPVLIERFEKELGKIADAITEPSFIGTNPHRLEFYTRMLFSTLIDADFLDTELHYTGKPRDSLQLDTVLATTLLQRLMDEKATKPQTGELNTVRNQLFQQCLSQAKKPPGFFSLTVPTGGGKTLSGMAFALAHALKPEHQLRRIIVVIPYLSIIEQNAAQYRRILDPNNQGIVIEHHSAVKIADDTDESRTDSPFEKHAEDYAAENWDAPIIVTTSVQFIESLFGNRTSRCRKLHNIAHSVIIFDEVQTLPAHLLNPLLSVFRDLRDNYGVSMVFSTATQPAFCFHPLALTEGFKPDEIQEITADTAHLFASLNRVDIQLPSANETTDWDNLANDLARQKQALCIVNVRNDAYTLWEKLRNAVPEHEKPSVFHLSSAMCAEHRLDRLGADQDPLPGTIRHRLRQQQPCLLVSTQLIEAGVDVDFPAVWRAFGPLDAIIQAAGRCNRENKLQDAKGKPAHGKVTVFRPEANKLPPGLYRTATDLTASLLADADANTLATDPTLFARYFEQLYQLVPVDSNIQAEREKLHFRRVADLACVIKEDTHAVIVPYGKGIALIEHIQTRTIKKGQPRFDRSDLRKLQRYMVNLRTHDYQRLLMQRALTPLLPNLNIQVLGVGWHHPELGIVIDQRPLEDFLI